ncbi:hypothetical protein R6Q57_027679 [Mikania cordata]
MGLSSKPVSSDHIEFNWTQNMLTSQIKQQSSNQRSTPMKRSLQTQQTDPLKCPRCDSTNTKFCYYNNYNKTQPRHFCKGCKRHWTEGGTLRNVPVGAGRKNKRVKLANSTTTTDHSLGLNDQKCSMFPDDKGLFFRLTDGEFHQVSWDFNNDGFINGNNSQNLGFLMHSNLSFSDTNPIPMIPTSLLSSIKDDPFTRTIMMPNTSTVSQPWMQVPTTSNFLEPNYWSWNDTDSMVQADVMNKPLDDPVMKH